MRERILSYFCLCLILIALFFIASFGSGFGYVYVQWLGWQFQTNLFVLLIIFFFGLLIFSGILYLLRKLYQHSLQKYRIPKTFHKLHPYEQLGIVWLLRAERIEQHRIVTTYQNSVLLYPLIQARLLLNQQQTENAKNTLGNTQNQLFELAELLKIDIALAEKDYAQALERLEFLTVQPQSTWLKPLQDAYQAELQDKWLQLSQICPWWIFRASHQMNFTSDQNQLWLQALLTQADQAQLEEQTLLLNWYQQSQNEMMNYHLDEKIILLKIMNEYTLFDSQVIDISENILKEKFIPEVLYIWLAKVLDEHRDITFIEQSIQQWQLQYPAQPSLMFATWHIYQRQQKWQQAEELLTQYPDDVYMAYLRLQNAIKASVSLQDDLKLLLQYAKHDFKFVL